MHIWRKSAKCRMVLAPHSVSSRPFRNKRPYKGKFARHSTLGRSLIDRPIFTVQPFNEIRRSIGQVLPGLLDADSRSKYCTKSSEAHRDQWACQCPTCHKNAGGRRNRHYSTAVIHALSTLWTHERSCFSHAMLSFDLNEHGRVA